MATGPGILGRWLVGLSRGVGACTQGQRPGAAARAGRRRADRSLVDRRGPARADHAVGRIGESRWPIGVVAAVQGADAAPGACRMPWLLHATLRYIRGRALADVLFPDPGLFRHRAGGPAGPGQGASNAPLTNPVTCSGECWRAACSVVGSCGRSVLSCRSSVPVRHGRPCTER